MDNVLFVFFFFNIQVFNNLPPNSDDEGKFGLRWNVVVSIFLGLPDQPDLIPLLHAVLFDILLSSLEDLFPLFVVRRTSL